MKVAKAAVVHDESVMGRGQNRLLQFSSDSIVRKEIWTRLHVTPSLLWRLRWVNRRWRRNVGSSLEWAALEIVRVDNKGHQAEVRKGVKTEGIAERPI